MLLQQLLYLHGHPLLLRLVEVHQTLLVLRSPCRILSSDELRRCLQEQSQLTFLQIRNDQILNEDICFDLQIDQCFYDCGYAVGELRVDECGAAVVVAEVVLERVGQVLVEQVQVAVLLVNLG